jgi:hypothetical protein
MACQGAKRRVRAIPARLHLLPGQPRQRARAGRVEKGGFGEPVPEMRGSFDLVVRGTRCP